MNSTDQNDEQLDALRALSDVLREAAGRHGRDYAATLNDVRSRIEGMPLDQRARLDAMLRSILRFAPPPSRVSQ